MIRCDVICSKTRNTYVLFILLAELHNLQAGTLVEPGAAESLAAAPRKAPKRPVRHCTTCFPTNPFVFICFEHEKS